ncbi:type II toxin-antitoxin system death-on-curing family toxin [Sporolactobacillus shoreae]|uniref:Type II toxin-antitoxin system death-on-curing family toxin n=1 Tax=Sporolactobacillus shoreae TaxID=1465501 RepID=A0A4Z0GP57_9BACL|nr:type II toxin-antitoxin system death-on-curing family toxin [Sporolactobacillus shoreae]TGA98970.1 type II toxin-antitoxin system death-on-curing family toxin [Sporolactobacillus shoreae]
MKEILFLSENDLIFINSILIKKYTPSEQIGVKEPSLLNSAVNRPKQSAFGQDAYSTIYEKAAALFQSVVQNHPFYNANKRTGFVGMVTFLNKNNIRFDATDDEVIDFTVRISDQQNKIGIAEASTWIENHSRSAT